MSERRDFSERTGPVTAVSQPDAESRPPQLIVVSYLANAAYSPRGIRTRQLLETLRRDCTIELIAEAREAGASFVRPHTSRTLMRKALHFIHSSLLLDKFEFWSRRRFGSWRPQADGALLIGFPFSPLAYASRRLAAGGIPYVVDIGDPWVLTVAGGRPTIRHLARVRAIRAERRMWAAAAGAVVTTEAQASALRELVPELQVLVRPNGYAPTAQTVRAIAASPRLPSSKQLCLAHFGAIYTARLNFDPLLKRLAGSQIWDKIEFHQYGSDWTGALKEQRDVRVVFHEQRPWPEVIRVASQYDLAVVIGNRDPTTLPSKAVEYLQLPIPRLAIVEDDGVDSLAGYVADKPGWVVIRADETSPDALIHMHLSREWTDSELAPPSTECWDHVAGQIGRFVLRMLNVGPHQDVHRDFASAHDAAS
jgi:hypothetical protein